jgi:hypothetical protein
MSNIELAPSPLPSPLGGEGKGEGEDIRVLKCKDQECYKAAAPWT